MAQLDTLSVGVGVALGVAIGSALASLLAPKTKQLVNHAFEKDKDKVVHKCPLPEIEEMLDASGKPVVAMCRCWKSKKMPYCDGSHAKHNKETGDNCGPLLLAKAA